MRYRTEAPDFYYYLCSNEEDHSLESHRSNTCAAQPARDVLFVEAKAMKKSKAILTVLSLLIVLSALLLSCSLQSNSQSIQKPKTVYNVSGKVAFYVSNINNSFTRSTTPQDISVSGDTVSQSLNSDGSVSVNAHSSSYADSGIHLPVGTISSFNGLSLTVSGTAPVTVNLWFDMDNNGEFFVWSGNTYTGAGLDGYASGPSSSSSVTVDSTSSFYFMAPNSTSGSTHILAGHTYTLAQLKAGAASGISGSTPVAVWIGVASTGTPLSSTLQSLTINP